MNQLKNYRLNKNLKQKDIADLIGVSEKTYKNYESERQIPAVDIAIKLASIYETTVENLFTKENNTIRINKEDKKSLLKLLELLTRENVLPSNTNRQRAYKRDNIKTGDIINNGSEQKVIIGGNNNKID